MPRYRCTASRRIADSSYEAGIEYDLAAELVQRYPAYFQVVYQAAQEAATPPVEPEAGDGAASPIEGAESAPKRRGRRF